MKVISKLADPSLRVFVYIWSDSMWILQLGRPICHNQGRSFRLKGCFLSNIDKGSSYLIDSRGEEDV